MAGADLPLGASPEAQALHGLFAGGNALAWVLTATALVPLVLVAWRFARPTRGPAREPSRRARIALQALFVVVPGLGLAAFGAASLDAMQQVAPPGLQAQPADMTVHVTARQWVWQFQLPNGTVLLDELDVPLGARVDLNVTSGDVIHSLFVPDLGVKVDAVPGRWNHMAFTAAQAGHFGGKCAQFCGVGHPSMPVTVVVS
jgi:cytochrome c oxidase subunit 2